MQIKRYLADDMRQALQRVKDEQGPDAVILSSRQLSEGLEVVAAVDYDESLIGRRIEKKTALSEARAAAAGLGAPSAAPGDTVRRRGESPGTRSTRPRGDEESLSGMREEIKALRRILECQLSSLAWNDFSRQSPVRAYLLRNLLRLGLPSPLAQELTAEVPADESDPARAWRHALSEFASRVTVGSEEPLLQGGVVALVGTTGVGKTTAVARLAARCAQLHGSEHVAMISTDNSRPGAQECLFAQGRLLNVPVYQAAGAEEVRERLARLAHVRVVLLDTAGSAREDRRFSEIAAQAPPAGRPIDRWLVLAADAQLQALEEALMSYRGQPLNGIIATRLDEAASLGGLLSVVAQSGLPLSLASDSPELAQPLRTVSGRGLVKRAVALMRASPPPMDSESLAQHVGEMHYALG